MKAVILFAKIFTKLFWPNLGLIAHSDVASDEPVPVVHHQTIVICLRGKAKSDLLRPLFAL